MNAGHSTPPVEAHWDDVYRTRDEAQLSWHQDEPRLSLELVRAVGGPGARAIDVGGGSSALAGALVADGWRHVTVLDIAPSAIDRARERAGEISARIDWRVGDVTGEIDLPPADLWHDRAVFHFLVDAHLRQRYIAALRRTLRAGGHAVIATFAPDGPERCSGLPVMRYDAPALAQALGDAFELIRSEREVHVTPWGREQAFSYAVFRRADTISHAHAHAHAVNADETRTT